MLLVLPATAWRTRWTAVAVAACAIVLAPWFVRNWIDVRPAGPDQHQHRRAARRRELREHLPGAADGQLGLRLLPHPIHDNQAQEAARLGRVGVDYARDHAGRLPAVVAARLGRSFELFHPRRQVEEERVFEGRDPTAEKLGVAMYYALALLAALGVVELRRRRDPAAWYLLAPVVLVVVVSATAYGFTRFRVGAGRAIVVLATVGIMALAARLADRRRRSGRPPAPPRPA